MPLIISTEVVKSGILYYLQSDPDYHSSAISIIFSLFVRHLYAKYYIAYLLRIHCALSHVTV